MRQSERSVRDDRRAHLAIAGVIVFGVAFRLLTLRATGFATDVGTFQAWAEQMVQVGPSGFYSPGYFSDYPPAYLYVLWFLGALFDGELLRLAVKAASIPADVAIAVGAAMLSWHYGGRANAVLAAALWSLSPGVIFAGPYWGQIDAVGSLPLFAALIAAGSGRWGMAGFLAALAAMIKPQFGIGALVIVAAALFELGQQRRWQPLLRVAASGVVTALILGIPFRAGPAELVALVRYASETYPYTSLFAFNVWAIVGDFWKSDAAFFGIGALLLAVGLAMSCAVLWYRRDVATFLAAGALAACAFYFLPTRAHERYLFPAFVLLLPFAALRARVLWPYVALSLAFAVTLFYAFTRYEQSDLRVPPWLESTLFSRSGVIAIALFMLATAGLVAWRLVRGEARLLPTLALEPSARMVEVSRPAWRLPAALSFGSIPTRRDVAVALLVALAVLLTRGYRLDHPRDMYFDEVYHARTAFELLAQREPFEWTHPHLAKQIMALGILAFGDDRVVGHEPLPRQGVSQFAVLNDGRRVYADGAQSVSILTVVERDGRAVDRAKVPSGRLMAATTDAIFVAGDGEMWAVSYQELAPNTSYPSASLPFERVTSLVALGSGVAVGGTEGLAIYPRIDAVPQSSSLAVVAMTARPDGSELYVLDPRGDVHVIDPATGQEIRVLPGGGAGTAIAFALGPNRLFVARAAVPVLDVYELPNGQRNEVPLGNGRTGAFAAGATALALVPRTQFLYALADGRVVVTEVHGASPFTSIPVSGSFLGVDGEDDKLLVAGDAGVERIETGRHALAWRLPGVISAAALAFFLVLLARRLFVSPLVALLAGAVVLLDGSMFAQARIGMNDVYVTTFIVAAWYFIVAAHRPRRSAALDLAIAGVLVGLGVASKWAAAYTLGGVFVASVAATVIAYERGRPGTGGPLDLLAGRGRNAALLFGAFAVIPLAIYLASYLRYFGGPTAPYGWNLWELTQQMFWYHSSLTAPHCAGSPWWSWPLNLKPVYWYFAQSSGNFNGYIYDAGNLVLFWGALPAAALAIALAIRTRSPALAIVSVAMLAQYVAWIPISRVLFFYHFFTVLPFYLLCLAAMLAVVWERRRNIVIAFFGLAGAFFVLFYPYLSGVPIPGEIGTAYQILPTWQYDPTFYPTDSCPTHVSASPATALTVGVAWIVLGLVVLGAAAVAVGLPLGRRVLARLGL